MLIVSVCCVSVYACIDVGYVRVGVATSVSVVCDSCTRVVVVVIVVWCIDEMCWCAVVTAGIGCVCFVVVIGSVVVSVAGNLMMSMLLLIPLMLIL